MLGWLANLFTGSTVGAIGKIIDNVFTSEEEKQQARYVLEKLRQQPYLIQAEINKQEARHKSVFVAGWRPFIGWVCGLGLAFTFLISPILGMFGLPQPVIPIEVIYNLVLSLLGIGAYRTYEKIRNVSSDDMKKPQPKVEIDWGKWNQEKIDTDVKQEKRN